MFIQDLKQLIEFDIIEGLHQSEQYFACHHTVLAKMTSYLRQVWRHGSQNILDCKNNKIKS